MNKQADRCAPAKSYLTHYFGRRLVDDGRTFTVERFAALSNGDMRRRSAETPAYPDPSRPDSARKPGSPRQFCALMKYPA